MVPKRGVGRVREGQKWSMKRDLGASWLPRVGWEGFGKVQNGSEECGGLMVPKSGVGRMETSAVGDSAGRRKRSLRHLTRPLLMKHEKGLGCFSWFPRVGWEESEASKRGSRFPRVGWEGLGKAQNEAWKRVWVLHGFPSVGWEGSGKAKNEAWKQGCVLHGSQVGWEGLGNAKMKHEKGSGAKMRTRGELNPTVTQLPPGTWPSNEKLFLPPIWPYFCTFATLCPPDHLNSLRSQK